MKQINLAILLFFSVSVFSQELIEINKIVNKIEYQEFNKNLKYLSSDELKGRDTGSEGYDIAANYIADKFKENGLIPFGDNDTYFQKVPLLKQYIDKSSIQILVKNQSESATASYGKNMSVFVNTDFNELDENQQLVFVGYGIIDSSLNINDYEGLDVKGKTVIAVLGAPKSMKDYNSIDPFSKVRAAVSQGATGLILFYPKGFLQNLIYRNIHGFLDDPIMTLNDSLLNESMFSLDLKIGAFAHKDYIDEIFKINNLKLGRELKKISKGENRSKILSSNIICKYKVKSEMINCKNVVALLPGEDETLKNEYVIVGAHLDHVGVGEAIKGDSIYNGMWDNATGAATLISISKTYNDANIKPNRSLVFVCYTGEEKGLLGSKYYANRNDIPGKMAANLNIDMLGGLFPTKDIIPMGYSHSTLSEAIDFAAKELNYIVDDNKQEENDYLFRSDQASFLELGVPVLNVANGYTAVNPKINGKKEIDKWMKKTYHSPFDDMDQKYSEETFLQAIKLQFLTTYYITNQLNEIEWKADSWIYNKYVLKE